MTTKKASSGNRGKAVNCYLRDSDTERIRALSTFISAQGYRVTDSGIIAAALRIAQPNRAFAKAFEEGLLLDGRKRIE